MDRFDVMWEPVRAFLVQVGEFFPKVMLALVILLLGWLIAKAVRFAVVKALRAINSMCSPKGGHRCLFETGWRRDRHHRYSRPADLLADHPDRADDRRKQRGPDRRHRARRASRAVRAKVIVAIVILAFGAYFARFIGMSVTAYCKSLDMPDASLFGRLAMYAIVVFVAMVAIDHLGLGDIIRQTFLILLHRGCAGACARVRAWRPKTRGGLSRALVAASQDRRARLPDRRPAP